MNQSFWVPLVEGDGTRNCFFKNKEIKWFCSFTSEPKKDSSLWMMLIFTSATESLWFKFPMIQGFVSLLPSPLKVNMTLHLKTQVTEAILWQVLSSEENHSQIIICLKSWKDKSVLLRNHLSLCGLNKSKREQVGRGEVGTATALGPAILVKWGQGLFVSLSNLIYQSIRLWS